MSEVKLYTVCSAAAPAGAHSQDESCRMGEKASAEPAVQPNGQIIL